MVRSRATTAVILLTSVAIGGAARAETELLESTVRMSGTGVVIHDGNDDQFRQRHGIPPDFTGGIEELRVEWLWEDGTIELDGRAMVDTNDYLLRLGLERPDKGYLTLGFREFRTWSDGTGGFFPQNGAMFSYFDEDLRLDRGEAWIETGLQLPDRPHVMLRYAHRYRDGQKSSLAWGDTALTGGFGLRAIVPAFQDVDEEQHSVRSDVSHEIRRTAVGAGFRYERSELDNSRDMRRRPNEVNFDRFLTQDESIDSDMYGAHAFASTPFLDQRLILSTAYSYVRLDNDIAGSRIYGADFNAGFDPALPNRRPLDAGFLALDGSTELRRNIGTLDLQARPSDALRITGGFRVEDEDIEGSADFIGTDVAFGTPFPTLTTAVATESDADTLRFAESLEARYTGIDDWVLYARTEWEQADGDLDEMETDSDTSTIEIERHTDLDRLTQKYVAGFIWYPSLRTSAAGRYSYRLRDDDYQHDPDSTDNTAGTDRYPAFIESQEIATHSAGLRLTWRVRDDLRLTTRYDVAVSDFDQRSGDLREVGAAEVTTHAIGVNASWNPTAASYVQTAGGYVLSKTDTGADDLVGGADDLVREFDNDYWTAHLAAGLAVDEQTDVELTYFFYLADNYNDNSASSQPYGSDAEEHGVSIALGRQITEHVHSSLRYAFFDNEEVLAGGANDYRISAVVGTVRVDF